MTNNEQYSDYSKTSSINANVAATTAPVIPVQEPVAAAPAGEQKPLAQEPPPPMSEAPPLVSQAPRPAGQSIVSREEKIEYRDQDGNILDAEQVKALEGKVSFKTRYETRTRMVDAAGNEIPDPNVAVVAPPHPDVDGVDKETIGLPEGAGGRQAPLAQEDVKTDEMKEESIEALKKQSKEAKPASEAKKATAAS